MSEPSKKEESSTFFNLLLALAAIILVVAFFSDPISAWWGSVEKQMHEWMRQWRYYMTGLP